VFSSTARSSQNPRGSRRERCVLPIALPACDGEADCACVLFDERHEDTGDRGAISMVLNVLLNIVFLEFFFKRVQNGGPALATALACYFDFFALLLFSGCDTERSDNGILRSFGKISLCASIME